MKRLIFLMAAMSLVLATALTGHAGAQDATFLKVAQDPALGAILTNADGMTVYLFTPDTESDESYCYDKCAENWPPVQASDNMTLPAGVPGTLGSFDRTDGVKQATYNGIPLYFWAKDTKPGDATGQGVGGVWFVVPPGAELGPYAPPPGEGTPVPATTPLWIGFTSDLGPFLVDSAGMTLYLFTADTTPGESACYDDCATNWPPLLESDAATALPVGIQGELGTIDRTDGTKQVTYDGMPLYYFAKDSKPGDTNGQGAGDKWWIVPPVSTMAGGEATPASS
jgi:predicted lipoprotein with Yx(FWY)xxD motif